MNVNYRKYSPAVSLVIFTAAIFFTMCFGAEISAGFISGVYFCLEALVPSVFPFMIISAFSVKSGVNSIIGRAINPVCRKLLGISGMSAAAVITGILGGYPVAARGIESLFESGAISSAEAKKCSLAAVCAGPGFLIFFVGEKLLNSTEIGIALFSAQAVSVILLLCINRLVFRKRDYINKMIYPKPEKLSQAFIDSVTISSYATIEMCAMVVIFSAVVEATKAPFLGIILEVTNACNLLSKSKEIIPLAFSVGFGGISVHFQIFQILKKIEINKGLFFVFRIIQGLLTMGITYLIIKVCNMSSPVFSSLTGSPVFGLSTSVTGSILLIITGASLIYNIGKGG
jgi:hypothetical protein